MPGTFGVVWVNNYRGTTTDLRNNDNNADGLRRTLDGQLMFNLGNDLAADVDFEQFQVGLPPAGADAVTADAVNLVFFSGHGRSGAILFGIRDQDDGFAAFNELRLGDVACKWAVFDACDVLNDAEVKVASFATAFAGLHYIFGFATECSDNADRGRLFARRLNDGESMRDAWIRACQETERSSVECAYLRAEQDGHDTYNDHWPGKGAVSADPKAATAIRYYRLSC